jgi:hypothetical protein
LVIYLNCTMIHGLTNLKFYIYILAHSVCKMRIIQEPKKVALWNKRHFEEKNGECAACLKYSVLIFVEKKYKMQHLEGSGTPVLYIGRKVLKAVPDIQCQTLLTEHLELLQTSIVWSLSTYLVPSVYKFFLSSLLCVIARLYLCCKYFVNPYLDKQFDYLVWIQNKSEYHMSRHCMPECPISVSGMSLQDNCQGRRVYSCDTVELRPVLVPYPSPGCYENDCGALLEW